jgi:hypothetical protein
MRSLHRTLGLGLPMGFLFAAGTAAAQGAPPAQGPLAAEAPAPFVPSFLIINTVRLTIQSTIDAINHRIDSLSDSTGVEAHLSFSPTTYRPMMTATQYPDRPNENLVRIPFIVSYDVTGIRYHGLPYFSRTLGQSIAVEVSCNDWFTNQGQVRTVTRADRPYLDGSSFGEDVLNFFIAHTLTDLVDSKLRQQLGGAITAVTDSLGACNRLGLDPGTEQQKYTDAAIYYKKVGLPLHLATALDASVSFEKIKRLPAHTLNGEVLYSPMEDIQLLFYANQTLRSTHLDDMKEGEERVLTMAPVDLGRLGDNASLVLICNVEQLTSFQRDTRFQVYTKETNFGNGVQTIVVQKTYWLPPQRLPDGRLTKPIEEHVDAYEITARINSPQPLLTEGDPVAPPSPGGRLPVATRAMEAVRP